VKLKLGILFIIFAAFLAACGPPPAPEGSAVHDDDSMAAVDDGTIQLGDFLEVNMVGTLVDTGDVFIDTGEIGQPIVFPYGEGVFFPGWDAIFDGKKVGDSISIDVPSEDAFGEAGAPPSIPPNADLHFEIVVLNILAVEKEVLQEGDGAQPVNGDTVRVHYTGMLEDGTVFDSSVERGEPIEFPLGAGFVIPGWDIGIADMHVGEKAILTIPSALGYGPQGSPPDIPPNATLIFEVELVEIVSAP